MVTAEDFFSLLTDLSSSPQPEPNDPADLNCQRFEIVYLETAYEERLNSYTSRGYECYIASKNNRENAGDEVSLILSLAA